MQPFIPLTLEQEITDVRVKLLEQLIADHYNITVYDLDTFYKDGPSKLMICFFLHDQLHYSIKSIAVRYRINSLFLRKNISDYYLRLLQDKAFFNEVIRLKDAFYVLINQTVDYEYRT